MIISFLMTAGLNKCISPRQKLSKIKDIWQQDTCGIYGERIQLTSFLLKKSNYLVGLSEKEVRNIFGQPDFIYNLSSPEVLVYSYSCSSIEILEDGKCGEAIIRSFAFLLDESTLEVKEVREFVH